MIYLWGTAVSNGSSLLQEEFIAGRLQRRHIEVPCLCQHECDTCLKSMRDSTLNIIYCYYDQYNDFYPSMSPGYSNIPATNDVWKSVAPSGVCEWLVVNRMSGIYVEDESTGVVATWLTVSVFSEKVFFAWMNTIFVACMT